MNEASLAIAASRSAGPIARRPEHRAIAVSEFFLKNRHLLGFDSPHRALLTAVKEAVDNSLDACESAGILPEVSIEVSEAAHGSLRVAVEDNGPGIASEQIGPVFGRLLYGSKFHKLAQSRGTQGIGISAAVMYAELTTGKPVRVVSRTDGSPQAWEFVLSLDTRKNRPDLHKKGLIDWARPHGTRVELELEGHHRPGPHSVGAYLEQTAIANPHATLSLVAPDGERRNWARSTDALPPRPVEIRPHPHGVELGQLIAMLRNTRCRTLSRFLREEFSRVGPGTARGIIRGSSAGLTERSRPGRIAHGQAASLHRSIARARIRAPAADCVVPIGEAQILAGLRTQVDADLYFAVSRPPAVYRGNPFVVEVGVAFGRPGRVGLEVQPGGHLAVLEPPQRSSAHVPDAGQPIQLLRYANRVPLMFQQSACAITKTVIDTHWHAYGLDQPRGGLPIGPLLLLVHVASVWVPFTSESKEAIAAYPEIQREIRLALMICGRRLRTYLNRGERLRREHAHRVQIEKYLPHVGAALKAILGVSDPDRETAVARLETLIEQHRRI